MISNKELMHTIEDMVLLADLSQDEFTQELVSRFIFAAREAQQDIIKLKELLAYADCPECGGRDIECQWCYDREQLLDQPKKSS